MHEIGADFSDLFLVKTRVYRICRYALSFIYIYINYKILNRDETDTTKILEKIKVSPIIILNSIIMTLILFRNL
jgi:hypothetical protein